MGQNIASCKETGLTLWRPSSTFELLLIPLEIYCNPKCLVRTPSTTGIGREGKNNPDSFSVHLSSVENGILIVLLEKRISKCNI